MDFPPVLFHVSPKKLSYVRPSFSRSVREVSYYVGYDSISWAVAHVRSRHSCKLVYVHTVRLASLPRVFRLSLKDLNLFCTKFEGRVCGRWRVES